MTFKTLAAASLAALVASAAMASGALTTISGSMVSGLADGITITRAANGALSVVGSALTGLTFGQLGGQLTGAQIPSPVITTFTCDGSTTAYTLGATPTAAAKVALNLGGVAQQSGAFTLSGATLTLTGTCANNTPGEAKVYP